MDGAGGAGEARSCKKEESTVPKQKEEPLKMILESLKLEKKINPSLVHPSISKQLKGKGLKPNRSQGR